MPGWSIPTGLCTCARVRSSSIEAPSTTARGAGAAPRVVTIPMARGCSPHRPRTLPRASPELARHPRAPARRQEPDGGRQPWPPRAPGPALTHATAAAGARARCRSDPRVVRGVGAARRAGAGRAAAAATGRAAATAAAGRAAATRRAPGARAAGRAAALRLPVGARVGGAAAHAAHAAHAPSRVALAGLGAAASHAARRAHEDPRRVRGAQVLQVLRDQRLTVHVEPRAELTLERHRQRLFVDPYPRLARVGLDSPGLGVADRRRRRPSRPGGSSRLSPPVQPPPACRPRAPRSCRSARRGWSASASACSPVASSSRSR